DRQRLGLHGVGEGGRFPDDAADLRQPPVRVMFGLVEHHAEMGAAERMAGGPRGLQAPPRNGEPLQVPGEVLDGDAEIDGGGEEHVPGDAADGLQMQDGSHGGRASNPGGSRGACPPRAPHRRCRAMSHGSSVPPSPPSPSDATGEEKNLNFLEAIIQADVDSGKHGGRVATRFPPEPNGFLHIGHAKSICLNFGLAKTFGGTCNLRFDDTNPLTEDTDYVHAIQRDVRWLGFDWEDRLHFTSDYFPQLYAFAQALIRQGKAYVCSLSPEEISEWRGDFTTPGRNSPYRDRSVEENLDLFERMRQGEFADGTHTLRAKIDMASPNPNMRDPAIYRIRKAHHHRTGDTWCVYPLYDFAHCLSDAIERITHSICTLEFENRRALYDWIVDALIEDEAARPRQYEFARLKLNYTVMSKRKLLQLVNEGKVEAWDDPRMLTLSGLRRRGYTPASIRDFARRIGVSKTDSWIDMGLLEQCIREDLDDHAPRRMAVLNPLKVTIET